MVLGFLLKTRPFECGACSFEGTPCFFWEMKGKPQIVGGHLYILKDTQLGVSQEGGPSFGWLENHKEGHI